MGVLVFAMRDLNDSKINFGLSKAREGRFARPSGRISASRAHLCHQSPSAEVDVGQRKRGERARGVLGQAGRLS